MDTDIRALRKHLERALDTAGALQARLDMNKPDLLGSAEVAAIVGWKPNSISAALSRGRLPEPYARLSCGPIWTREQIDQWLASRSVDVLAGGDAAA